MFGIDCNKLQTIDMVKMKTSRSINGVKSVLRKSTLNGDPFKHHITTAVVLA